MANERVKFLDTTLRDGEQSAGIGMTVEEKVEIAKQLERLQVDIIEAGFAASSPGDFQAVSKIANEVRGPVIASLARAHANDVDQAWQAIKGAASPRIHVFLSSSDIHVLHQLRKNREEVMEMAVTMVERAKGYCDDVEFSPMDATRTNPEYLFQMLEAVIAAGATTINVADTVGYAIPSDFARLLREIQANVKGIENVTLSVHCHNDLGLAVSNSLAAIEAGARQVEGCINGIGERAGNASLEEIIMGLDTRKDLFNVDIGIDTTQIYPTSRLVSRITGMAVQANKAVVGENAFRHASGIHQDGVLKDRSTYEVMQPERVGVPGNTLVLGKLSGRAGLQARLEALGFSLSREEISSVFESFKELADKKREVTDRDLEILMDEEKRVSTEPISYTLDQVHFSSGDHDIPTAT
ncbi:MAG: 2-isopropylmalate synthase, partial [Dehalococcoidia bacterium]